MKKRLIALILAAACLLALPALAVAEDSAETEDASSVSESADESSESIDESSESGEESSEGYTINLPTPTIDKAYLSKDDEGYTIIIVEGEPCEELEEINAYLAENNSYPIGVEFYVNINNEGFVKVDSRGEKASEGVYSMDLPASYTGKYYKSAESYFQIQMRYVYDYDWIRITQSEWSNTLEINPKLSGIDLQKQAERAGNVTTLLWIGGLVVLVVLLIVIFSGGDRRCPHCRGRVPKKQNICPSCGFDLKLKKMPDKPAEEAVQESAEDSAAETSDEPAAESAEEIADNDSEESTKTE